MPRKLAEATPTARYTLQQGQYLAFIYAYTTIHRRPPAEADMQAFFGSASFVSHRAAKIDRRGRAKAFHGRVHPA